MIVEKDRALLEALCEFLCKNGCVGNVSDYDGVPVMVMEYTDKESDLPEFFNISVEHFAENTAQICILQTMFSDLNEQQVKEVIKKIPDMNRYLTFGSFGVDRFNRSVYFSCALDIAYLADSLPICFTVSFDRSRHAATEGVLELMPIISSNE